MTDTVDPFDEVVLAGPPEQRLASFEFFKLTLAQRLRHVIGGSATFLRAGAPVDPCTALAQRRADRVAG